MAKKDNSLSHGVYTDIKNKIFNGEYPPGTRLEENLIQETYSCSRTIAREVISKLSGDGIVKHTPYKGATVIMLSQQQVMDLLDMEELMSGLACRYAALRCNSEILNKMVDSLKNANDYLKEDNVLEFMRVSSEFHSLIFEASGSEILITMGKKITAMTNMRTIWLPVIDLKQNSYAQHEEILEMIRKGDSENAEQLMRDHIRIRKAQIKASFEAKVNSAGLSLH